MNSGGVRGGCFMDASTSAILNQLGICSTTVPAGSVRLLGKPELNSLGERSRRWSRSPWNQRALAYAIDTEHDSPVGVALRNLYFGEHKDHLLVARGDGPFWFGFHRNLSSMYTAGIGVFVEGPKDALVLETQNIPAIAFLGVAPTREHLRIITRYLRAMVWIRDNDLPDVYSDRRAEQTRRAARSEGLQLIEMTIPAKDPAELVRQPEYFDVIRGRVREWAGFLSRS
jgi:hypothetical protein